jgi:hypothetical protein
MKKQINGVLKVLFKEVLELMPAEEAKRLVTGYKNGQNIVLFIGQSSHSRFCKTAFGYTLTDSQNWRHLPETEGTVH